VNRRITKSITPYIDVVSLLLRTTLYFRRLVNSNSPMVPLSTMCSSCTSRSTNVARVARPATPSPTRVHQTLVKEVLAITLRTPSVKVKPLIHKSAYSTITIRLTNLKNAKYYNSQLQKRKLRKSNSSTVHRTARAASESPTRSQVARHRTSRLRLTTTSSTHQEKELWSRGFRIQV